eukprot:scaffold286661_cov26-Tisochrysis_lutea.AAC.7
MERGRLLQSLHLGVSGRRARRNALNHTCVLWGVAEHCARDELQRAELEFLHTVPCDGLAWGAVGLLEDELPVGARAVLSSLLEIRVAALSDVALEDQDDWFGHLFGGRELTIAIR